MFAELSANKILPYDGEFAIRELIRSTYDRENLRLLQSLLQIALRR